jgi:surface antigen
MSSFQGMNVAEVEDLGRAMVRDGERAASLAGEVDALVRSVAWAGPDAERFVHDWWPAHKARLTAVSEHLAGLGQSALNNASEQRQTSGEVGAGSVAPPTRSVGSGPDTSSAGGVGASTGSLDGSRRTWQEVQRDYESRAAELGVPSSYQAGATDQSGYQCTAWAVYRWRELGFEGDFGLGADGRMGHGAAMASNNGGSTSTPPSLGAMASYGTGYGHVVIVEEVMDGGDRIRVSEMNTASDYELGRPEEYRSDRVLVRQADGTWADEAGGRNRGAITFASLPR